MLTNQSMAENTKTILKNADNDCKMGSNKKRITIFLGNNSQDNITPSSSEEDSSSDDKNDKDQKVSKFPKKFLSLETR